MSSSSLLPSKYFYKLQVNRLKANDIKSDNIVPTSPSYLFSAVFNNAIFDRNNTGGTLTITKDSTESIIQFSDRPFRQTENINFDTFVSLFDTRGNDSFEEDPPNGVLTHDEEQRTYIIRLLNRDLETATFSLELLPGESHNLNTLSGRMNLFVDDDTNNVYCAFDAIYFRYNNNNNFENTEEITFIKTDTNGKRTSKNYKVTNRSTYYDINELLNYTTSDGLQIYVNEQNITMDNFVNYTSDSYTITLSYNNVNYITNTSQTDGNTLEIYFDINGIDG